MGSSALGMGVLAALAACAMAAGCGSSNGTGGSAQTGDDGGSSSGSSSGGSSGSGDDAGGDAGSSSGSPSTYPAFTPEMPALQSSKGKTLAAAKVVTVTWQSDTNGAALQDFDDKIGPSSYWKTALTEYGIGATTSGASDHVVVTTAPPNPWAAADIDTWVQTQAANAATSGWPAPDANTVYMVFVPPGTSITDVDPSTNQPTDACNLEEGYHTELSAGSTTFAYALDLETCSAEYGTDVMSDATETAAHEIAEAVTDPFPDSSPGWYGFDADHLGWELWNEWQDEIADACQYFDEGYYQEGTDLPYWVSRLWSNASAKAGHDPCVPVPSGPYNNVSPLGLESVSVKTFDAYGTISPFTTKGWHIAPGQTAKVKVGLWSDAPMAAWSVQAAEGDCCTDPKSWPSVLTVSPTSFTGKNGDTVELTITAKAPADGTTAALLTFRSAAGNKVNHYMPVVIGVY